jgi:hypothetical protein
MGREHDTARRRDDIDRKRGDIGEEKGRRQRRADVNITGSKNEENLHDRFSYYKWTLKI